MFIMPSIMAIIVYRFVLHWRSSDLQLPIYSCDNTISTLTIVTVLIVLATGSTTFARNDIGWTLKFTLMSQIEQAWTKPTHEQWGEPWPLLAKALKGGCGHPPNSGRDTGVGRLAQMFAERERFVTQLYLQIWLECMPVLLASPNVTSFWPS